jgi:hypothetical protein
MATTFTPPTLSLSEVKNLLKRTNMRNFSSGRGVKVAIGDGNSLYLPRYQGQGDDFGGKLGAGSVKGLNIKSVNANIITGAALFGIYNSSVYKGQKYSVADNTNNVLHARSATNADFQKAAKTAGVDISGMSMEQAYNAINAKGQGIYAVISRNSSGGGNHFYALYKEQGDKLVPFANASGEPISKTFNGTWHGQWEDASSFFSEFLNNPVTGLGLAVVTSGSSLVTQVAANAVLGLAQGKSPQDIIRGIVGTIAADQIVDVLKNVNVQIASAGLNSINQEVISALANAERQAVYAVFTKQDIGTAALAGAAGGFVASASSLLTDSKALQKASGEYIKNLVAGKTQEEALTGALTGYLVSSAKEKDDAEKAIKKQLAKDIGATDFDTLTDSQRNFLRNTFASLNVDISGIPILKETESDLTGSLPAGKRLATFEEANNQNLQAITLENGQAAFVVDVPAAVQTTDDTLLTLINAGGGGGGGGGGNTGGVTGNVSINTGGLGTGNTGGGTGNATGNATSGTGGAGTGGGAGNVTTGNVSTGNVTISGNASTNNTSTINTSPKDNTILLGLLNNPLNKPLLDPTRPLQGSPGSAALAQALRIGDAGAPVFGGDKDKSKRSGWNRESLRYMGNSGDSNG